MLPQPSRPLHIQVDADSSFTFILARSQPRVDITAHRQQQRHLAAWGASGVEVREARVDAAAQGGALSLGPRPLSSGRPSPCSQSYLSPPQSPQLWGAERAESCPQRRLQGRQYRPAQGRLHCGACEVWSGGGKSRWAAPRPPTRSTHPPWQTATPP